MSEDNIVDNAVAEFFDENSELNFERKFSNLRQAYMWNALRNLKKIQEGQTISEEEERIQADGFKQFKLLEMMYQKELRANKHAGEMIGSGDKISKDWLKKVKESDTLGNIVVEQKKNQ